MVSFKAEESLQIINNYISVKDASAYSGYSQQYLRRLLRTGKVSGIKIGQVWLIEISSIDAYLDMVINHSDRRFGVH